MKLKAWALSDVGNVRTNNEDNFFADADRGVFVVADGVGGRDKGEVASSMVAAAAEEAAPNLRQVAREADPVKSPDHRERMLDLIRRHIQQVNTDIFNEDTSRDNEHGMATTTDLLVVAGSSAYVGHVGDSRVYLIRNGQIYRITEDHTYAEMLRRNQRAEMRRLAEANKKFEHMLTRSMGAKPHVEPDTLFIDVRPGDQFVLCTDGLTDYLSGSEILERSTNMKGQRLVDELVAEAKQRGGRDNITVVVVDVLDEPDTARTLPPQAVDTIRQINFLEQIELFDGLAAVELIKVLRTVYERSYSPGDIILRQGEQSGALYLIVEGEIALTVDGTEVARLHAGQHFGELALFADDHTRSATATCASEALLLVIPADKFEKLTGEDLEIGNKLLRNLVRHAGQHIRMMNARLAAGAHMDTMEMMKRDLGKD
jgi:serine/threonine protein phosphatase PrpC/CRP-like cAMP-binding protein